MGSPKILLADALINLVLRVLLATFPKSVVDPRTRHRRKSAKFLPAGKKDCHHLRLVNHRLPWCRRHQRDRVVSSLNLVQQIKFHPQIQSTEIHPWTHFGTEAIPDGMFHAGWSFRTGQTPPAVRRFQCSASGETRRSQPAEIDV